MLYVCADSIQYNIRTTDQAKPIAFNGPTNKHALYSNFIDYT